MVLRKQNSHKYLVSIGKSCWIPHLQECYPSQNSNIRYSLRGREEGPPVWLLSQNPSRVLSRPFGQQKRENFRRTKLLTESRSDGQTDVQLRSLSRIYTAAGRYLVLAYLWRINLYVKNWNLKLVSTLPCETTVVNHKRQGQARNYDQKIKSVLNLCLKRT